MKKLRLLCFGSIGRPPLVTLIFPPTRARVPLPRRQPCFPRNLRTLEREGGQNMYDGRLAAVLGRTLVRTSWLVHWRHCLGFFFYYCAEI